MQLLERRNWSVICFTVRNEYRSRFSCVNTKQVDGNLMILLCNVIIVYNILKVSIVINLFL